MAGGNSDFRNDLCQCPVTRLYDHWTA